MTEELVTVFTDYRWSCPKCSRFIAFHNVQQWQEFDPEAYYGISETIIGLCSKCGLVNDPRYNPTKWKDIEPDNRLRNIMIERGVIYDI